MRGKMTGVRGVILLALMIGAMRNALAEIDSNSIIQGGVEYYIQTDKSVYDLGENVNILYRISNLTNDNIVLQSVVADPLAYYDFRVTEGDEQIWGYPYMSPVLGFSGIFLEPYESKEFHTFWNMMNDNGTIIEKYDDFLISPGIYNVVGEVALYPVEQRVPISVSIDIIPEPSSLLLMAVGVMELFLRNKKRKRN